MRIAILQHSAGAGAAALERWLVDHEVSWHPLFAGSALPALEDFDLLLLLGGSMSVHDERQHGWMAGEKRLIHQSLLTRKRVFGAGLGAQLLAEALGARISACPDGARIGWWPLEKYSHSSQSPLGRMLPQRLLALHWQHEGFSLPHGAIPLYGSAAGEQQGFVWHERAIALQCHLECDGRALDQLLALQATDLQRDGQVQDSASLRDALPHAASSNAALFRILDYLSGGHAHMT